jgi:hypothetical protein
MSTKGFSVRATTSHIRRINPHCSKPVSLTNRHAAEVTIESGGESVALRSDPLCILPDTHFIA